MRVPVKAGLAGARVARSDELRGSPISGAQRFGGRLGQRAGCQGRNSNTGSPYECCSLCTVG